MIDRVNNEAANKVDDSSKNAFQGEVLAALSSQEGCVPFKFGPIENPNHLPLCGAILKTDDGFHFGPRNQSSPETNQERKEH